LSILMNASIFFNFNFGVLVHGIRVVFKRWCIFYYIIMIICKLCN
jgi:hypothetical protein